MLFPKQIGDVELTGLLILPNTLDLNFIFIIFVVPLVSHVDCMLVCMIQMEKLAVAAVVPGYLLHMELLPNPLRQALIVIYLTAPLKLMLVLTLEQ
jgi:hypothetical protein|tara:strand:+ start:2125 stop:2412 length:288 start_codon:yes stop_codon:yes gene_type:complete